MVTRRKFVSITLSGELDAITATIKMLNQLPDAALKKIETRPGSKSGQHHANGWIEITFEGDAPLPAISKTNTNNNTTTKERRGNQGGRPVAGSSKRQQNANVVKTQDPLDTKICTICKQTKTYAEFSRKTHKNGYITYTADCLVCRRAKNKKYLDDPVKAALHREKVKLAAQKRKQYRKKQ